MSHPWWISVQIHIAKPIVENSPPQSITVSLLILQKAGWCHSDFEFNTMCWLLLMWMPLLTCLDRQSLNLPVTVAESLHLHHGVFPVDGFSWMTLYFWPHSSRCVLFLSGIGSRPFLDCTFVCHLLGTCCNRTHIVYWTDGNFHLVLFHPGMLGNLPSGSLTGLEGWNSGLAFWWLFTLRPGSISVFATSLIIFRSSLFGVDGMIMGAMNPQYFRVWIISQTISLLIDLLYFQRSNQKM